MNKRIFISIAVLIAASYTNAQTRNSRLGAFRHSATTLVRSYSDSISNLRKQLGSELSAEDGQTTSLDRKRPESYSMITPLTYFNAVTSRSFGASESNEIQDGYDMAMARMYVKRPDLVKDSQRRINQSGGIAFVPNEPVKQDVNFTKQAEKEAEPKGDDITVAAPVDLVQVKPNFWTFAGDYSLQFLQNYVSDNWYKGGESNYAMIGAATLQLNYNDKDKIKFDNKLEMKLGMQSSQGDTIRSFKSSEDLIRLTSKLGVQATKKWYYTLQMLAETQFTHGYKSNDPKVYSDFMSPFKLNLSLGMDYKAEWCNKKLTGTVNISPLAANYKYYNRLNLASAAGYAEGRHAKWDFGSTFTADLTWKFSDVVKWQTRLYAYTTYHRTEVEWENTFTLQLSKYISTKVFLYPRFDDSVSKRNDKYGYFQMKEYWSLGFNYTM